MAILHWNDLAEKQLTGVVLFIVMVFTTSLAIAQDKWSFEERIDELTDKKIAVASHNPTRKTGVSVRCEQRTKRRGKFEVYFVFGEYLNRKTVPIRYRIDNGTLVEDKWWPSAKGTGVFASPGHGAEIARQMMRGSKVIVEATDFRGQRHRIRFGLAGASKAIEPVLQLCSISRIALHYRDYPWKWNYGDRKTSGSTRRFFLRWETTMELSTIKSSLHLRWRCRNFMT